MSKAKRATESYLESAKLLAPFVPSLRRYKRRKTLKPWQKAHIARYENWLRFQLGELKPVTKKQAKEFKNELYKPETQVKKGKNKGSFVRHGGVQAVRFRNTGAKIKLKNLNKDTFVMNSNGRTWLYWRLNEGNTGDTKRQKLAKAGARIFTNVVYKNEETDEEFTGPDIDDITGFDIEQIIEMSRHAFENPTTKAVYLWAESGRVGMPMTEHKQFMEWIIADYSTYKQTNRWVMGLAVLLGEVGEYITDAEFSSFGMPTDKSKEDKAQRRHFARLRKQRGH